jgi:hypothetical protein
VLRRPSSLEVRVPAYSRLSRSALLALAVPLIDAARRQRSEDLVLQAADTAELARLELEAALRGRRSAGLGLSAAVAAALAAEESLDRRIGALHRALDGLADLGDGPAEDLRDLLFPAGPRALTRAVGRAQVPEYTLLADGLAAESAHPALARLDPYPSALRADLLAFIAALSEKDGARDEARGAVLGLGEAGEALRAALQQLDRAVELVCGGVGSAGYRAWAGVSGGLG